MIRGIKSVAERQAERQDAQKSEPLGDDMPNKKDPKDAKDAKDKKGGKKPAMKMPPFMEKKMSKMSKKMAY